MKRYINSLNSAAQSAWFKVYAAIFATLPALITTPAQAINATDLTQDTSGGKKLSDVAENLNNASQTTATLIIQVVAVAGFVVVALSLYQLYKASKDEREKPVSAFVGLFVGGAMAAVGTIMWIMKNTVIGTTGP